jgi:hypothetical protein
MLDIELSRVTPLLLAPVLVGSFVLLVASVDDSLIGSVGSGFAELAGIELGDSEGELFSVLVVLDVVGCELSMFVSVGSLLMVNRSFISDLSSSLLLVVELVLPM